MPKPKKQSDAKIFDVGKPGKVAPSASSRPIIVKRAQIIQDPMVRSGDKGEVLGAPVVDEKNKEIKKLLHPTATRISIKPVDDDKPQPKPEENPAMAPKKSDQPEAKPGDEEKPSTDTSTEAKAGEGEESPTEAEARADDKVNEKNDEKTDSTEKSEEADEQTDSSAVIESPQPDSIVDELAKQAVSKKQKEKEDKEAAAKDEKTQKLVDDKTYFLPVGRVTRRRNARRVLFALLLILLLGIVVADLAIDAGIIKTDIKPLTHLFNR